MMYRALLSLLLVLGLLPSAAQNPSIAPLERAFADGASSTVMAQLSRLLDDPGLSTDVRFEACMLMAECHYQRFDLEHFTAWTDSADALLTRRPSDEERWARVEMNRCRYAHASFIPEMAHAWGMSALKRLHQAPDRSTWKSAYLIHQTMGSMYRNWPGGTASMFAHFDTALVLLARRKDVLPYWKAMLHKSISNAAMDLMRPGKPDRQTYAAKCSKEQQEALRILNEHHPAQLVELCNLQNLRGLYWIYQDRPDSALKWLDRTENLVGVRFPADEDALAAAWFICLRWRSFVLHQPPWNQDALLLNQYLDRLKQAEERFARFAAERTTAEGLFFRDRYWTAPYTTILSTCAKLWSLTGDTTYIEQALRSAERVRRDAWNTAQIIRGRQDRIVADPPVLMLQTLQARLSPDEAILLCAENSFGGVDEEEILLAVAKHEVRFLAQRPRIGPGSGAVIEQPAQNDFRRVYHLLYQDLYQPIAPLLAGKGRVRVFPSGYMAQVTFDALLADTTSQDIRSCAPLVERHAFSYPLLILSPETSKAPTSGPARYIPPHPGQGALTDLARLRAAMRIWAESGAMDTSVNRSNLRTAMSGAREVYLGGHCVGGRRREEQPRHYFVTDTGDMAGWFQPSDLLALDLNADLVVHLACQSGLFDVDQNGGAISFARAFLFAGAHGVVSSQYLADEASTIRLIGLFREELTQGLPRDVAMQRAKLAYLAQCSTTEETWPIHWAGWQVWGDGHLAAFDQTASTGLVVIAVTILLAGAALLSRWWWKRRIAAPVN